MTGGPATYFRVSGLKKPLGKGRLKSRTGVLCLLLLVDKHGERGECSKRGTWHNEIFEMGACRLFQIQGLHEFVSKGGSGGGAYGV